MTRNKMERCERAVKRFDRLIEAYKSPIYAGVGKPSRFFKVGIALDVVRGPDVSKKLREDGTEKALVARHNTQFNLARAKGYADQVR